MRTLLAIALAFCAGAGATTVIGPSEWTTLAEVQVPDNLGALKPNPGDFFRETDLDSFDQSYTFTVSGGTGRGYLLLYGEASGSLFPTTSDFGEVLTTIGVIREPWLMSSIPFGPQGNAIAVCGTSPGGADCLFPFDFDDPFGLRIRMDSIAHYAFTRFAGTPDLVPLGEGVTYRAWTTIRVNGAYTFDPGFGFVLMDNATIRVDAVPEPATLLTCGSVILAVGLLRKRIRARLPAPGRA